MKYATCFYLLFAVNILFADIEPQTVYTEDRFFVTSGVLEFSYSMEDVTTALLKFNDYSMWALNGLQGVDKESEGLIVYFTSIDFSIGENLFYVTFDLNLGLFGRRGVIMKFKPYQTYSEAGTLKSIVLIPEIKTRHIENAELEFILEDRTGGVSLSYSSKIRLSRFLDFFFSLKSFRRNFEWYVVKVADNLSVYLGTKF